MSISDFLPNIGKLFPLPPKNIVHPILINYQVHSNEFRYESIDGNELFLTEITTIPFVHADGKTYHFSHLQKKAKFFSLLFKPYFRCWGWYPHPQEYDVKADGSISWKPGTEKGIYWALPGIRWQVPDARSNGTSWIQYGGRAPGMHYD